MADDKTGSPDTSGSLPQERVENRPNVGIVKPEDYPKADREASAPDQASIDDEQAGIDQ